MKQWHQFGDLERFTIEETRFGMFVSVLEDGTRMVFGLTPEAVLTGTQIHQEAHAPGYDGRYDLSTYSGVVGGKL